MTTICKAILSGASPQEILDQTAGLTPAWLRDLAVRLAGHPDLTVSVIIYDDGRSELEVLYSGPPHHTVDTIDHRSFARSEQGRTMPVTGPDDLQEAAQWIRATLRDAPPPPDRACPGRPALRPRAGPDPGRWLDA